MSDPKLFISYSWSTPEFVNKPSFLSDNDGISLGTTAQFRRCLDAIKNDKPYALGAFDDYCNTFITNLERFRITDHQIEYMNAFFANIEGFTLSRNEIVQLFVEIAKYKPDLEYARIIHNLFKEIIPYFYFNKLNNEFSGVRSHNRYNFDNFKFLANELF